MWPAVLSAGGLSLVNLAMLALAAAVLVRLLPLLPRVVAKAPFRGSAAVLSIVLVALLVIAVVQIVLWGAVFVACGEFADFEEAIYHSAVNFTTLGYGDLVMSRRWRLLGPLEALNGSLMLGLSAAILFAVMNRIAGARPARPEF